MAIKIYIDQGHNPSFSNYAGAVGNGLFESEINYIVGIYLRDLLVYAGGFEVMVSRETPFSLVGNDPVSSQKLRVEMANTWQADYFISIHCNSNLNPRINGSEVYIYRFGGQAEDLGRAVLESIVSLVGTKDNGVRSYPTLYVLRKTTMPAILVEMGYLTNLRDAEKLYRNTFEFAYAMYLGILDYLGM